MNILTVSQINFYLKSIISENNNLTDVFICGELSNFKNHYKSGHLYFSLKDEKSIIKCVMFSEYASRIKFLPEDGLKVLLRASVGLYEAMGQYQLYVYDMQPYGIGNTALAFEQLKNKLDKLGFFDETNKKALPLYPETIGVITADKSAALNDIITILTRRFPIVNVVFYPVLVQGQSASAELTNAVQYFNSMQNVDLIIISRGGGSYEDLSAFNDEALAVEIHNSSIPIISGVGHQTDFTICDFVADLRVPTPSSAAELSVPDKKDLLYKIDNITDQMFQILISKIKKQHLALSARNEKLTALSPENKIHFEQSKLSYMQDRLNKAIYKIISKDRNNLDILISKLTALNPTSLLSRGYALVFDDKDRLVRSSEDIKVGQTLKIKLHDGSIHCIVTTGGE